MGADERDWEGMERASCEAAVCSEWARCSLLIPSPSARWIAPSLPKAWATVRLLLRGSHSEVKAGSRTLWRPYVPCGTELLLFLHLQPASPQDAVHLLSPWHLWGYSAWLACGWPYGPPEKCWWGWCLGLDVLPTACWQWHMDLMGYRRDVGREVKLCSTYGDICGAVWGRMDAFSGLERDWCLTVEHDKANNPIFKDFSWKS